MFVCLFVSQFGREEDSIDEDSGCNHESATMRVGGNSRNLNQSHIDKHIEHSRIQCSMRGNLTIRLDVSSLSSDLCPINALDGNLKHVAE